MGAEDNAVDLEQLRERIGQVKCNGFVHYYLPVMRRQLI